MATQHTQRLISAVDTHEFTTLGAILQVTVGVTAQAATPGINPLLRPRLATRAPVVVLLAWQRAPVKTAFGTSAHDISLTLCDITAASYQVNGE
jgi:hypothetical protein